MMKNSNTEIGEIISVSGNVLTVQMANNVKSNMPIIDGVVYRIGQVGSFVKIPLGYVNLYGIVTGVGAAAIPENLKTEVNTDFSLLLNNQWLNVVLIGEQIGNVFNRGISQSPTTSDKVHLVIKADMEVIYGGFSKNNSINIGIISSSENLPAKINIDKLVTRHCAILGSTGSGKSNAVGTILNSIAQKNFPSTRVLIIDPHGEYNDSLKNISSVYKINANTKNNEKELNIPFWALPFDELMSLFSGNLNDSNKDYIRQNIENSKRRAASDNNINTDIDMITADSPIPFSIKKTWFELDDFERQTFNERANPKTITEIIEVGNVESLKSNIYTLAGMGGGKPFLNNSAKGILSFLNSMRLKIKDTRYKFLFTPGEYTPNDDGIIKSDLDQLLHEWLGQKSPITILDLSGVPSEIMTSVTGCLLKIVYDSLFWGQETLVGGRKQPLFVVLEEAHNYLKNGADNISSRIIQTIAKEGRKYGIGVGLVSQRPSELDETVLSQCGTIISLRMNNSKDRAFVSSAMQDELQSMLSLLPSLRTGEAIISGESVKIPSRVLFSQLPNISKSSDPLVSEEWGNEIVASEEKYKEVVKLWRDKKTRRVDNNA